MPRKGLRSIFFHPSPTHSQAPSTPPKNATDTFRTTLMEDNIATAEQLITKWDLKGSSYAKITFLFYEDRKEAQRFLQVVQDLHQAMHFFSSSSAISSSHHQLVRGQHLMQTAMDRLQKEFQQILLANRDCLDSDSISSTTRTSLSTSAMFSDIDDVYGSETDEIRENAERVQRPPTGLMVDLRAIAKCMIACGYARECMTTYKSIRRFIVDEGLFRLGFDRLNPKQILKLDPVLLDRRIKSWLVASSIAVRSLFSGERMLSDFVFAMSDAVKESCFAEITRDAAVQFLGFPELAVLAKGKQPSPERAFQFLEMYSTLNELWPEIEAVFSYQTTAVARLQAEFTQQKLGESIRDSIADFETTLQKDSKKVTVPDGAVHPLTQYAMDYMVQLAHYAPALVEIYTSHPFPTPHATTLERLPRILCRSSTPSSPCSPIIEVEPDIASDISAPMAWLLLILLCKLDKKADLYRDPSLAYLFLTNNLHYVLSSVRQSKLFFLLGDEWIGKHEKKVNSFAMSYEQLAWSKVLESIPKDPATMLEVEGMAMAKERMKRFNRAFEEACKKQASWVVLDKKTAKELRKSIARKVMVPYSAFYEQCRERLRADKDSMGVVRYSPEDVGNHLSDLFQENYDTMYGSSSPGSFDSVSRSSNMKRRLRLAVLKFAK